MAVSEKTDIQDVIFEHLVWRGWLVIRVNSGRKGNIPFNLWQCLGMDRRPKGAADLMGCTDTGQFFAIECKKPGKKPTPEQEEFLQAVERRGGLAIVADGIEAVE